MTTNPNMNMQANNMNTNMNNMNTNMNNANSKPMQQSGGNNRVGGGGATTGTNDQDFSSGPVQPDIMRHMQFTAATGVSAAASQMVGTEYEALTTPLNVFNLHVPAPFSEYFRDALDLRAIEIDFEDVSDTEACQK